MNSETYSMSLVSEQSPGHYVRSNPGHLLASELHDTLVDVTHVTTDSSNYGALVYSRVHAGELTPVAVFKAQYVTKDSDDMIICRPMYDQYLKILGEQI